MELNYNHLYISKGNIQKYHIRFRLYYLGRNEDHGSGKIMNLPYVQAFLIETPGNIYILSEEEVKCTYAKMISKSAG